MAAPRPLRKVVEDDGARAVMGVAAVNRLLAVPLPWARWRVEEPSLAAIGAAVTAVALLPALVAAACAMVDEFPRAEARYWLAVYVVLVGWIVAWSRSLRQRMAETMHAIESMLREEQDVEHVRDWLDRHLKPGRQFALCASVPAGATALVYLVDEQHVEHGFGFGWYAAVWVTGFFATDAISWMVRIPMVVRLLPPGRLRVVLHAPATTAGIRALSGFLARMAFVAAVGFFLFAIPLIWASRLPDADIWLRRVSEGIFVVSLGAVVYVAVLSQLWLARIVERERDRVLEKIAAGLPDCEPLELLDPPRDATRTLYDSIAATSTHTSEAQFVLKQALVLATAIVPYLSALLLGNGSL